MTTAARKILVVFGTRPEAIKLAPVILALGADPRFEVATCSSGQHRDMIQPVCDLFGIAIDHDLGVMRPGQSLDHVTAAILDKLPAVFAAERPDVVMVQGDTTTAFSAALSAFYHRIPIAHVEAGLRTKDLASPFPEEGNRALISRLARWHFAPTRAAREHLVAERCPGQVVETGNSVVDAARLALDLLGPAGEAAIAARLGLAAPERASILFTMHRRECFGAPATRIFAALRRIAARHDVDILYPVHPNPQVRGPAFEMLGGLDNVRLVDPLGYDEMIVALKCAHMLVTDSGGLAEEAPTFSTPALILRKSTERPESIETGNAELIGHDAALLEARVAELLSGGELHARMSAAANPFGDGRASERIAAALATPVTDAHALAPSRPAATAAPTPDTPAAQPAPAKAA
ncbi:non-hydrolyzing UDP-N-acetylglucosamine 2-epimerase [Sphingomicrobium arenosum]|uniref:non-hydrolyzing UDP-N-acetylglucosamine 2-epimerase n=1 Tax=Sphingomicrobium arenosum TaxID=2233861 RepID=UPI0022407AF8|nr:UDP-N-acetylglucosamine 2-epimerase (non-hydrolyzing) [Sphingomicrobium arenosum]